MSMRRTPAVTSPAGTAYQRAEIAARWARAGASAVASPASPTQQAAHWAADVGGDASSCATFFPPQHQSLRARRCARVQRSRVCGRVWRGGAVGSCTQGCGPTRRHNERVVTRATPDATPARGGEGGSSVLLEGAPWRSRRIHLPGALLWATTPARTGGCERVLGATCIELLTGGFVARGLCGATLFLKGRSSPNDPRSLIAMTNS